MPVGTLRFVTCRTPRPSALTGVGFWGSPCVPSSVSGIKTPNLPLLPAWEKGAAHRGRFLGKPLRAIFRFRHQDAPTPLSPLVGEGGRGDEGQKAWECRKPRIAPKNSTLERKGARGDEGQTCTGMQKITDRSQETCP